MSSESLRLPVDEGENTYVSAALDLPDGPAREVAVLLAHGAGAPLDSTFLRTMAADLCQRGLAVMRFHYPYMERRAREGRTRPPDRRPVLEAVHRAAALHLRTRFPRHRLVLAGKSLGGRIASLLAAKGEDCDGLVFFGYPLHPPRKPDKKRSEHFPAIAQPALFLQGTRDPLCDLELLAPALETFGGVATLRTIEGGDHSFEVLKRSGRTTEEAWAELGEHVDAWLRATFGV